MISMPHPRISCSSSSSSRAVPPPKSSSKVVWKLSERSWNCWAKISVIWLVISSMMPSSSPLAFSTSSRWSER